MYPRHWGIRSGSADYQGRSVSQTWAKVLRPVGPQRPAFQIVEICMLTVWRRKKKSSTKTPIWRPRLLPCRTGTACRSACLTARTAGCACGNSACSTFRPCLRRPLHRRLHLRRHRLLFRKHRLRLPHRSACRRQIPRLFRAARRPEPDYEGVYCIRPDGRTGFSGGRVHSVKRYIGRCNTKKELLQRFTPQFVRRCQNLYETRGLLKLPGLSASEGSQDFP